ncbi:MAG: carbohydrate kinase [Nitrosomonadales bacterium]|nr:carbohydrate kinase [Nitrosomonadales bacterium]
MTEHTFFRRSASRVRAPLASRGNTIVLFGEVLADIFPDRSVLGGAPFNVACHLKAFGQNPVLVTRLGNDALRDEVLHAMAHNGMRTLGVQRDKSHPTGRVLVHIGEDGHRFEILPMQAYDFIHPAVVRMISLSVRPVMVYYGTLAQRHEISRRALKTLLRSTGAPKFLDINLRAPWYDRKTILQSLQYANIVKLNVDELEELSEMLELPEGDLPARAREFVKRFDIERLLVTCGEDGAWQIDRDGGKTESGAKGRTEKLVDTVGAGDGFASVCMMGELRRWPATLTLERANAFAASICGIRGAVPDHADFYKPFIKEWGI